MSDSVANRIIIHNGLEGRAEHYSFHPFDGGNPLYLYADDSGTYLRRPAFAKILLVEDLLGRISIHQHPNILTGEPLRVALELLETRGARFST